MEEGRDRQSRGDDDRDFSASQAGCGSGPSGKSLGEAIRESPRVSPGRCASRARYGEFEDVARLPDLGRVRRCPMGPLARRPACDRARGDPDPLRAESAPPEQVREIVAEPSSESPGALSRARGTCARRHCSRRSRRPMATRGLITSRRPTGGRRPWSRSRRGGRHRSLRETKIGVRLIGTGELTALHDVARRSGDGQAATSSARNCATPTASSGRVATASTSTAATTAERCPMEAGSGPPRPARAAAGRPRPYSRRSAADSLLGLLASAKGVGDLAEACLRTPHDEWRLTIVGPDTGTTPFKQSMRARSTRCTAATRLRSARLSRAAECKS